MNKSSFQLGRKPSLLLVDDSPEDQRRLLGILQPYYRVIAAFDGQQGYQRAIATTPDITLLDVRMPKMDGYAACRMMKADPLTKDIPVIFLSALTSPENRIEGLTIGGVDYITKPFVAEEVLARVRIHLDLARRTSTDAPAQPAEQERTLDRVLVAAAMCFIKEHLHLPLSLAEIAAKVGSYEKKLSQMFRIHTGLTVFAYIREQRISRARQLLEKTGMSMEDIAEQVGFQSAANFATAFRERVGVTPSAYRQSMCKRPLPIGGEG